MVDQSQKGQIREVIKYLDSNDARDGALDIILAYSNQPPTRELFRESDCIKQLLRHYPEKKHSLKICQCLINFSLDDQYVHEMVELNIAVRVLDFLKGNVKADIKTPSQSQATYNTDDQVYEVKGELDNDMASIIELSLMLLSNVSVKEIGQKHILGDGKTKGAVIDILFGMFLYFKSNAVFDFTANIIANVSALKEGREYMLKNKILQYVLDLLHKVQLSNHRRRYLIEAVRNMLFEYEENEAFFVEIELIKRLNQLLINELRLKEVPEECKGYQKSFYEGEGEVKDEHILSILDCFKLLANSDKLLKLLRDNQLETLLCKIECQKNDELQVMIQVLQNQMVTLEEKGQEEQQS